MATRRIDQPITAEEFAALPSRDDCREELVRGFVVREPLPGARHAAVAARLVWLLTEHVRNHGPRGTVLTEAGFVIARGPDQVRGPDVAYVAAGRFDEDHTGFIEGGADLAIEVLSPRDRPGEIAARLADQFRAGARLCWVVDPRRRAIVVHRPDGTRLRLGPGDTLDGGDVLPGLEVPVAEIFGG